MAQSGLTLYDLMVYIVHVILQARILEWVALPFSRGFFQSSVWTQVSCIACGLLTSWATREAQEYWIGLEEHWKNIDPSPEDQFHPGIEPGSSALQHGFFTTWAIREAPNYGLLQMWANEPALRMRTERSIEQLILGVVSTKNYKAWKEDKAVKKLKLALLFYSFSALILLMF